MTTARVANLDGEHLPRRGRARSTASWWLPRDLGETAKVREHAEPMATENDDLLTVQLRLGFVSLDLHMQRTDFALLGAIAAVIVWLSTRHLSVRKRASRPR